MSHQFSHNHYMPNRTGLTREDASGLDGVSQAEASSASSSTFEASVPSSATSTVKKHKSSKAKTGKQLARSFSTPQLRDGAMSDSDSDKKRNKLGYQRISIACAHCRRRKIRCVMSDMDAQQRCQNCIRLKKECVFYPVDQQAAMENRSESSGGKLVQDSGPPSIVSSSPTNQSTKQSKESSRDFPAFAAVPSNAPSNYNHLPLEPGSALLAQNTHRFAPTMPLKSSDRWPGGFVQPDDTYRADGDTRLWSTSATGEDLGTRMQAGNLDGHAQMFQRYTDSPGSRADYAPFPTNDSIHAQSHLQNAQGFGYPLNSGEMSWQQPQPLRSVSHGQMNQLHDHAASYQPTFPHGQRPQASPAQYGLHALNVSNPVMMQDRRGPYSAPVENTGNHPMYQTNPFMFQQPHANGDESGLSRAHTYPTGWYPDHNTYASLAEEPEDFEDTNPRPG